MISTLKHMVEWSATRLGYAVIPHWRLNRYPMARHLARMFDLLAIDLVLDVGANSGQYRQFLREEVGYDGWVVSFEPNPYLAALLAEHASEDSRWAVERCALGAAVGTMPFNLMKNSEFSSFLQPSDSATARFAGMNSVSEQVTVPVETLDNVLPILAARYGARHLYLKLDTQGFDLEVIKGGIRVLSGLEAVQVEASVIPIYEHAPDYVTEISTLQRHGFEPSGFYPNNDGHFPRLIEFDCIMIAKRYAE
jgi:FkbM family methyltransferase